MANETESYVNDPCILPLPPPFPRSSPLPGVSNSVSTVAHIPDKAERITTTPLQSAHSGATIAKVLWINSRQLSTEFFEKCQNPLPRYEFSAYCDNGLRADGCFKLGVRASQLVRFTRVSDTISFVPGEHSGFAA